MVHALVPDPVPDVLAAAPVQVVLVLPTAAALARLVKQLVISVFTADSTLMVCPAVGADLAVRAVPV